MRNHTVDMTINLRGLTIPQAAAMRAMFQTMRSLGGMGSSRWVSFYADGDGNFRPRPTYRFSAHRQLIKGLSEGAGKWEDGDYRVDFDSIAWKMSDEPMVYPVYPDRFRRIRFWLAWLFGGDYHHPRRGSGWQPSLLRLTRKWWAEDWHLHRSWWSFCRPPRKRLTPKQMKANFAASGAGVSNESEQCDSADPSATEGGD